MSEEIYNPPESVAAKSLIKSIDKYQEMQQIQEIQIR